jgi:ankyrin repeat protein
MSNRRQDCETYGSHKEIQSYFDAIADEASALARTKYEKALAAVMTVRARRAFDPIWPVVNDATSAIMDVTYKAPEMNDFDRRDHEDKTPLMNAAEAGSVAGVTWLLQQGANPNRTRHANDLIGGDSALTLAMNKYSLMKAYRKPEAETYVPAIKALLSNSATDPNLRDRHIDYTPLMKALSIGEVDVVELLLKAGADPNLTAYGGRNSALQIAAQQAANGQPAAVTQFNVLLASKRVNLDLVTTYLGQTALTEAAGLADSDIVRRLLAAGADPNAPDRGGNTPLLVITINALANPKWPKYVEAFRLIAGWPAVRMNATYQGKTALQMVTEAGRTDLADILLESSK